MFRTCLCYFLLNHITSYLCIAISYPNNTLPLCCFNLSIQQPSFYVDVSKRCVSKVFCYDQVISCCIGVHCSLAWYSYATWRIFCVLTRNMYQHAGPFFIYIYIYWDNDDDKKCNYIYTDNCGYLTDTNQATLYYNCYLFIHSFIYL